VERDGALVTVDAELVRLAHMMASRRGHELRNARSGTEMRRHELAFVGDLTRHGPSRLTDVANRLQMELPHASRTSRQLAAAGFVTQSRDPSDGRAVVLAATRRGSAIVGRYRDASRALLGEALEGWSDGRVEQLAGLLSGLTEAFARQPDLESPTTPVSIA
jgi:DNA-binding MarR family transcriptional regulator